MEPLATVMLLVLVVTGAAGHSLPDPFNVTVSILDGEMTVHWSPPEWAPLDAQYEVQYSRYQKEVQWMSPPTCRRITSTWCDLSGLITVFTDLYWIKVRLVSEEKTSDWIKLRATARNSDLRPPVFSTSGSVSSLSISIKRKPLLRTIFPQGLTYYIYLQKKSSDEVTIIEHQDEWLQLNTEVKQDHLQWGSEYCVRVKAEAIGNNAVSDLSSEQCLLLPEPEWYRYVVLAASSVGTLLGAVVLLGVLCCTLRRPEKLPVILKPPRCSWRPLSVRDVPVEIVTDRGFLLVGSRTEEPSVPEEGDRRHSQVSMEQVSADTQQEDSGCGSLGEEPEDGDTGHAVDGCLGVGGYRSQSPAWVESLAEVAEGYRPSQLSCVCSGAGQCLWCRVQDGGSGPRSPARSPARSTCLPASLTHTPFLSLLDTNTLSLQDMDVRLS